MWLLQCVRRAVSETDLQIRVCFASLLAVEEASRKFMPTKEHLASQQTAISQVSALICSSFKQA